MPAAGNIEYQNPIYEIGEEYRVASIAAPDEDADKIYQTEYKPILEQMIDACLSAFHPHPLDMVG